MGASNTDKIKTLSEFARRAAQRMQDKQVTRYVTLYAPDLDCEIKFRNLSDSELLDCFEMESDSDPNVSEKYAIYVASVEPSLKATAQELMAAGELATPLDIMDMFSIREVNGLAKQVMEHSEAMGGPGIKRVTEKLKNASGATGSQT